MAKLDNPVIVGVVSKVMVHIGYVVSHKEHPSRDKNIYQSMEHAVTQWGGKEVMDKRNLEVIPVYVEEM
jgi:hypothetical protein